MCGRRWMVGAALLAVVVACHRRPRPTYEYEATETFTSTAVDPTPERVPATEPPSERSAGPPIAPAGSPATEQDESVDAVAVGADAEERESASEAPAAVPPDTSDVPEAETPSRWYKAKPW